MNSSRLLTHKETQQESIDEIVEEIKKRIQETGDLAYASVEKQLKILNELMEFPLGRFLIQNKGLNGFWTDYIVRHPFRGRLTGNNSEGKPFGLIEKFLLDRAPSFIATQQRFINFQDYLQNNLKKDSVIASVPSGLMGDLLTLHYPNNSDVTLIGIDMDQDSIDKAKESAKVRGLLEKTEFRQMDAWDIDTKDEFDFISSNGLNIYESDDDKVTELYKKFYESLKPGGSLITSFLTPPPDDKVKSNWDMSKINMQDLLLQKIIFIDVLGVKWMSYRSPETTKAQLKKAGFKNIKLIYDDGKIFPTVIVSK